MPLAFHALWTHRSRYQAPRPARNAAHRPVRLDSGRRRMQSPHVRHFVWLGTIAKAGSSSLVNVGLPVQKKAARSRPAASLVVLVASRNFKRLLLAFLVKPVISSR
jgi:hypothetical protein